MPPNEAQTPQMVKIRNSKEVLIYTHLYAQFLISQLVTEIKFMPNLTRQSVFAHDDVVINLEVYASLNLGIRKQSWR